ncbi:MAG: DUF6512 family protein [Eubacteriales bacterium]|nr:DUF6512 family protein [Eubacteriales bacterium]
MKKLKNILFIGLLFSFVLGTIWHFLYNWTGQNQLVGIIAPIDESVFQHFKLTLFPTLLYLPVINYYLKKDYPAISQAFCYGILCGTGFLPIFHYTYSGILGFRIEIIDILSFYVAEILTFLVTYHLAKSGRQLKNGSKWLFLTICAVIILTYKHPDLAIFAVRQ